MICYIIVNISACGRKVDTDISDGLADLAKRGMIDPQRARIVESGYGGYSALAGATLNKTPIDLRFAVVPMSDLRFRYNGYGRETGRNKMYLSSLREQMGDPSTDDAVSPRRFANRADAPNLLLHGTDDMFVDF